MILHRPQNPPQAPVTIRTYRPEDYAAVTHLYTQGLLVGDVDAQDAIGDLLDIQRSYFSKSGDHFWVAVHEGRVVGMVGVTHRNGGAAQIRRLRVEPSMQSSPLPRLLIETVVQHCVRHGDIKIVLDTHVDERLAMELLCGGGFLHARSRQIGGKSRMEFYLDLYRQPKPAAKTRELSASPTSCMTAIVPLPV